MRLLPRLSALALIAGCAAPAPPSPPPTAPTAPTAEVAVSPPAPSGSAALAGGWAVHEAPSRGPKAPRPPVKDLASCAGELRAGEWLEDQLGALEYQQSYLDEQAGLTDAARRGYFNLVSRMPTSPAVPMAYLAFGELFAADSARDPSKYALARQAYAEALKTPPERLPVHAFIALRKAEAEVASGEPALGSLQRSLLSSQAPGQRCAGHVRERAVELLLAELARSPGQESAYRLLRAAAASDDEAMDWLERLAARLQPGNAAGACQAARSAPRPRLALVGRHCGS